MLGTIYENGYGCKPDIKQAFNWYRQAAELGLPDAQHTLGLMYFQGKGVTQDFLIAYAWTNLAIVNCLAQDYMTYTTTAMEFEANLTPEQMEQGKALSKEWAKKYKPRN